MKENLDDIIKVHKLPEVIKEVKEEDINKYKFTDLLYEVLQKTILIKINKNITVIVPGKIIRFSELIKKLCCTSYFDYKLTLDDVERHILEMILEFLNIVDWRLEEYFFELKSDDLKNWYEAYKPHVKQIKYTAKFLGINHVLKYLNLNEENIRGASIFKTQLKPILKRKQSYASEIDKNVNYEIDECADKKFEEANLPKFNPENISLELDIDLNIIKKNATKNFSTKGLFNPLLNDPKLNKLLDALVLDSFWFIVAYIQSHNLTKKSKIEEKTKEVFEILKRISSNYFRFFINLCDDNCVVKKKDPVLNLFRDFIAQCVFYSLHMKFPKSRHLFNEEFKKRILSIFAYLYHGVKSENNFTIEHWDLDLGLGNILEKPTDNPLKSNKCIPTLFLILLAEDQFRLPDITDFQNVISKNLKSENISDKYKVQTILNTPLYRMYAENNKFQTLNLIKPIHFHQTKNIDMETKETMQSEYLKKIKEALKLANERKKWQTNFLAKNEKVYNEKL